MTDNGWIRISPSQVATKRRCFRKWAFQYIKGLRPPTTADQSFGIEGHDHLAKWLTQGIRPPDDDAGRAAIQGIERGHLPAPGPGLLVERRFEIPLHDLLITVNGVIDLVDTRTNPWRAADHKFVKSLRYAKAPADAEFDPQSVAYCAWLFGQTPSPAIDWSWIYYAAKGKERPRVPCGTKVVTARISRDDLRARGWAAFLSDCRDMVRAKHESRQAETLPHDPTACDEYGGCPFRELCPIDSNKRIFGLVEATGADGILTRRDTMSYGARQQEEANMGLLDNLRGTMPPQAQAAPAQPQMMTQPFAPANPPGPAVVNPPEGPTTAVPPQPAGMMPQGQLFAQMPTQPQMQPQMQPPPQPQPQQVLLSVGTPLPPSIPSRSGQALGGLIVLIDCLKAKGEQGTQLVDLLSPVAAQLAQQTGVRHWTEINYNTHGSPGSAFLSRAFGEWLDANRPTGTILVDGSTAEARAVLEVLTSRADVVIRGVR